MNAEARPIFTLRLQGQPGQAGIHRLRTLLKRLLRDEDLVCIDAHEETNQQPKEEARP